MRDYPKKHCAEFEDEWGKALNRFEYDFITNFGNTDWSINWEKLLRYNSGKEKVVWISPVAPITNVEIQEENDDTNPEDFELDDELDM